MRLWSRMVLCGLALTLALSLSLGTADAASSKKAAKKKEVKKEKKKEAKKAVHHASGPNHYVSGTNLWGRAGLLIADTSEVAEVGQVEGSVHFTYQSLASLSILSYTMDSSMIGIPFGAHFGVAKNVDLSASGNLGIISTSSNIPGFTAAASTSVFTLTVGGKYRIAGANRNSPDFSVGGDIIIPTNAGGQVVAMPKGTITYVLDSGLLLNGEMGLGISTVTYFVADAGVGVPFGDKFTAIAEIGANQYGYLGSMLGLGLRVALSGLNVQGILGVPLNGGGVMVGAGLSLASN